MFSIFVRKRTEQQVEQDQMRNISLMPMFYIFFRKRTQQEVEEAQLITDCQKFVRMAGDIIINQQALIMATSDDKGYDLQPYKEMIMKNMSASQNSSTTSGNDQKPCKTKKKSVEELMYGIDIWKNNNLNFNI